MEHTCAKCEVPMVKAKVDSFPIRVYKAVEKPTAKTMSNIGAYVCSHCGSVEFYVDEPEKFEVHTV